MVKTLPSTAGGAGSVPGWRAKIPHALWPKKQNIKQKQYCNKLNKEFKKWGWGWGMLLFGAPEFCPSTLFLSQASLFSGQ